MHFFIILVSFQSKSMSMSTRKLAVVVVIGMSVAVFAWEYTALEMGSGRRPSVGMHALAQRLEVVFGFLGTWAAKIGGVWSIVWEMLAKHIHLQLMADAAFELVKGVKDVAGAWLAFPRFFEMTALFYAYPTLVKVGWVIGAGVGCFLVVFVSLILLKKMRARKEASVGRSAAVDSTEKTEAKTEMGSGSGLGGSETASS